MSGAEQYSDSLMPMDKSNGWEAFANQLISGRQQRRIGAETVSAWAHSLTPGSAVLDLGCGSGVPVSELLINAGFQVYGVDASPTLIAEFRRQFPTTEVSCEAVEESTFFGRSFAAVVAVGLLFLLSPEVQFRLIHKVGQALVPGGQFLFTSPCQMCRWEDNWTGRESVSLGAEAYKAILAQAGLNVTGNYTDEGENYYFVAVKN
ncbi:MAG: class I SAM-dependent methyltransferase [Pseudomonadota bacterium]